MDVGDFELGLTPSGVFVPKAISPYYQIANPYRPDTEQTLALANTITGLRIDPEMHCIDAAALDSYADALAKIATGLLVRQPGIVLVPLRGAIKAWRQLETMCLYRLHAFKLWTSGLGAGRLDPHRVKETLRPQLSRAVRAGLLSIAIVDTAKGGNGCFELAKILKELHEEDTENRWEVEFHLILPRSAPVLGRMGGLHQFNDSRYACWAHPYEVDDLLVEDWDPAFGVCALDKADGKPVTFKLLDERGARLAIRQEGQVFVLESKAMHDLINKLLADRVTVSLLTDPALEQIDDLTRPA